MNNNEPCPTNHAKLFFGSGDYYLFCQDCGRSWVMRFEDKDEANPFASNKGESSTLSGQYRFEK